MAAGSSKAGAQQAGFAINRFEPSERGSEWFAQDTLDFRGHLRPFLGVVGDYGHKPLVAYDNNGDGQPDFTYKREGGQLALIRIPGA